MCDALAPADPANTVFITTGHAPRLLQQWFGHLPVGLVAEHGFFYRFPPSPQHTKDMEGSAGGDNTTDQVWWTFAEDMDLWWHEEVRCRTPAHPWLALVQPVVCAGLLLVQVHLVLRYFVERTPGAVLDVKHSGFSFHFRDADPVFGDAQAKALQIQLDQMLFHANIEVCVWPPWRCLWTSPHWMTCGVRRLQVTLCPDKKYVVVQPGNINKGSFVTWLLADPSVVPITVDEDAMSSGQPSSSGPDAAVESPESSRSAPPSDSGGSLSFGAGEAPPSPELGAVAAAGEVLAVTARAEAAPSTTERAAASSGSGRSLPDLAGLVATPPPPLPPPQQSRRGRPRGDTAQSAWSLLSGSGVPRGAVLARCWWCH